MVAAHYACMSVDEAKGRYIVTKDMVKLEDVLEALKELYPSMPVAEADNMDYASGVPGQARKIESRTEKELGVQFHDLKGTLKDAIDSMMAHNHINQVAAVGA